MSSVLFRQRERCCAFLSRDHAMSAESIMFQLKQ